MSMRQLTSMDSTFIYLEGEGKQNHLTGVYIYDQSTAKGGRVRFKDLLANIESRLHRSPVFRQKLVRVPMSIDYPYWVDDENFDVEFHVRHIALPEPGDWRQFSILVARLHSRPLDMSRPAWEMYIVEGLDAIEGLPPGYFAVIPKYHHSAIDGATGVEILGALHDLTADTPPIDDAPPWQPIPPPGKFNLLSRAAWRNRRSPFLLTKSMAATVPALRSRSLKKEQNELPEDSLVATMPISTRAQDENTPGNRLSAMMCPLNTQIEDPAERLQAITRATHNAKETANALGARQMTDMTQHIPLSTLALAGRVVNGLALGVRTAFCNCIVTNVPGPQHPIHRCGAKLLSMWGCGPVLDGVRLLILAVSYDGKVFLSAIFCREIMPDASVFAECLQQSFDELQTAVEALS